MKYLLFFLFIRLLDINSQTDSIFISDFKDFLNVSFDFYNSSLKFDSDDWFKFSATIGFTGFATLADKKTCGFSQRNQNNLSNDVFSADKYCYAEFIGVSIIDFYGYRLIIDNPKARKLAVKLTEEAFLASSISLINKIVVGRGRPSKQENQHYTNPLNFDNDSNSFPSGHTTLAFAYSAVMANEVDNVFWKLGWYTAAGLVGYSRIYHDQPWFSDVLMGAAIGYFSGEFVNNNDSNNKEKTKLSLLPYASGLAFQLSL